MQEGPHINAELDLALSQQCPSIKTMITYSIHVWDGNWGEVQTYLYASVYHPSSCDFNFFL